MSKPEMVTVEGNEAAAHIAHLTNEVIAIYPITPSSPMGEYADAWSAQGRTNLWGVVPRVVELQSEAGAAGAVHGALQAGELATTFTASQGLLLMIPNMFKIAGELTPAVIHVAARTVATHALSIFGDHSDVMAVRATGFAMLASCSVQEVMDMALIAQSATLAGRVPVLHFFDGFRTSHEVAKIAKVPDEVVRAMIDDEHVRAHRARGLNPERPVIRGTSQNPDVYFQSREAVSPFYARFPEVVQRTMDRFAELTGRRYHLFDYFGSQEAERVVVLMGSGCEATEEVVETLLRRGEKVGMVRVRLFRPFAAERFLAALPPTVRRIAVLDRTKEPGADGEPLYKDVLAAVARAHAEGTSPFAEMPLVVGGRYGLSSKEFNPQMIKGVFDELARQRPKNGFTVGIVDDVCHSHIEPDPDFRVDEPEGLLRAVFFGLGSDGTVSANKNTIKIIGEETDLYAQGYFVYDSKKAGAVTVSHLRFSPEPIRSTYLIGDGEADFVGCHQPRFLDRFDMLAKARPGAVFLLNTPAAPDKVWDTLPRGAQAQILEKGIRVYAIDAVTVARETGMGSRINTIMQACFFAVSGLLPREEGIAAIKRAVEKTYGKKGERIVERNFRAIDMALEHLYEVPVPGRITSETEIGFRVPEEAPDFVRRVTAPLIAGKGDELPVSVLPCDGTYPTGTARWEKRNLALEIPVWEPELCIFCGKCVFVCPHSAIRSKVFHVDRIQDAPPTFKHTAVKGKEFEPGMHIAYQVAPEDCTGCSLCVEICPARSKTDHSFKALNMRPQEPLREQERENFAYFLRIPPFDRTRLRTSTLKGAMVMDPLFEFSGACVGCGETPYIRLATQLFGDRMLIANATGCSSIYGGNLPTTPYTTDAEGRGPAWNNSLFEDNAEFGYGMRLAIDQQKAYAEALLRRLADRLDEALVRGLLEADQSSEAGIHEQRQRVKALRTALAAMDDPLARELDSVADALVRRSVWIVGGDGWAYDIGFGGLDHVLSTGADVNILVLDTEVYSNTGGQASKATPRGAIAKFAANGKMLGKKDLAEIAMSYEHVYVAQVAFGAKDVHTLKAFLEAESYPGTSLIIAYSPCIEHGIDLTRQNLTQQQLAVDSGHWPLFRYDPRRVEQGLNPLQLDSKKPSVPYREFIDHETRFNILWRKDGETAEALLRRSQQKVLEHYFRLQQLAGLRVGGGEEAEAKAKPERGAA
ncbi:pyruvate:ferredoxin (flavodoxin) oxidoreductase [Inmirania thermothiophila]|uniref:Pyruvate-flavodoxin oxidoreductase n=1 Tax=Inmirania thermothiophila TaxID=1750597 RepID=A0A3N1Y8D2_9GAMM|nr:pyruvate:ferredoxin (flavodoxin) oxidoreductase [Inmirania thermothiophila]ROR35066.1 pyruvate-ferredoxin/flavodoxin oxidoreductase [Inmirania thermothiophila]